MLPIRKCFAAALVGLEMMMGSACSSPTESPTEGASTTSSELDVGAGGGVIYCEEPGRFVVRGGVVDDRGGDAGLVEWQRAVPRSSYTQPEAAAYCEALRLDGRGWRLPSVDELASLVLHPIGLGASRAPTCEPSIDQVAFPETPPVDFWTSTTRPGLDEAFYTGFDDGRSHPGSPDTPMAVRCVRAAGDSLLSTGPRAPGHPNG
jgi:hypothetical protein